jgi:hypothetical protein
MPTSGTAKDGQSTFYGWIVLSVAFITIVLGYAIRNNFAVFYPTIVEKFGWEWGSTELHTVCLHLPLLSWK